MTPLGFLPRVVFTLITFGVLVFVFALFQHWLETGLDEGPPDVHHEDETRRRP